jgi:hypothetical protein
LSLLNKRLKVKKSHHQSGTNDGERSAHADIAEVVGNNIIIHVTQVGEKYYETEFKIIREADPLRMELIRVEEISNPKFSDASVIPPLVTEFFSRGLRRHH